jgi:chaperone required for assembly of F1-ATPase
MKRFWDSAEIEAAGGAAAGWQVLLDGRPVRVPGGAPLKLPNQTLALAVAAEWQAAGGGKGGDMSYADLPLTRIAGTGQNRIAANPEPVILELAQYGESDLLCYRATHPPELATREALLWQPWLDWAADRFAAPLMVTSGVVHVPQQPQSLVALTEAVAAFDPLALAALGVAVPALGSLVLGLALAHGELESGEAHALATLDESFQEQLWGADDQAVARRHQIAADIAVAARFLDLLHA